MTTAVYHASQLPWDSTKLENGRFGRILISVLGLTLLFTLWVSWVELPEVLAQNKKPRSRNLRVFLKHNLWRRSHLCS